MGVAEVTNLSYGVRGSGHEHHRERHLRSAAAARPKHQNRIGVEEVFFCETFLKMLQPILVGTTEYKILKPSRTSNSTDPFFFETPQMLRRRF